MKKLFTIFGINNIKIIFTFFAKIIALYMALTIENIKELSFYKLFLEVLSYFKP